MNLEEFSEDIQKMCLEQIEKANDFLDGVPSNRENMEHLIKVCTLISKWAMLWMDIEKRKKPKEVFIPKGAINIDDVEIKMGPVKVSEECDHVKGFSEFYEKKTGAPLFSALERAGYGRGPEECQHEWVFVKQQFECPEYHSAIGKCGICGKTGIRTADERETVISWLDSE